MNIKLPDYPKASVLVFGDIMLDRYWTGGTSRISPEAPVPVVNVRDCEDRPGGAANVALNLASLGVKTAVSGLVGNDATGTVIRQLLSEKQIVDAIQIASDAPTITKLRVMSRHQQLIRLDFEETFYSPSELSSQFLIALDAANVLVLSDYAKGTLSAPQTAIEEARKRGVPVLVDPKGSDFGKYRNATLLTPNLSEFTQIVGHCDNDEDMVVKAEKLRAELNLQALLVTLSERGMLLVEQDKDPLHLPTRAREVFDVTGAGDTVIATLAASLAAGMDIESATRVANIAAGIAVGKLGTATVTVDEIRHSMDKTLIEHSESVVSEEQLLGLVAGCRERGEVVAMTNGCFDLLHPGHVAYLAEAAALADRLIIAVNSDESVRQLKGEERPINPLQDRMAMLAGIKGVDWVCAFSEETPQRLIARVLPDYLIKGGDYKPEEIAGYAEVTAAGGEVKVLKFLEGYSSTNLIKRIKSL